MVSGISDRVVFQEDPRDSDGILGYAVHRRKILVSQPGSPVGTRSFPSLTLTFTGAWMKPPGRCIMCPEKGNDQSETIVVKRPEGIDQSETIIVKRS